MNNHLSKHIKRRRCSPENEKYKHIINGEKLCKKCNKYIKLNLYPYNKRYGYYSLVCQQCLNETNRKNIYKKEYQKKYYLQNKNRLDNLNKEWRKNNRDKCNDCHKKWRQNKECKLKEYNYQKQRRKTNLQYKLRSNLKTRMYHVLNGLTKSDSTVNLLGCTINYLKYHLELLFDEKMSWENYGYGKDKWHIDHKIPCEAFDLTKEVEQRKCFHYSNLQPKWEFDNLSKNDRLPNGQLARHIPRVFKTEEEFTLLVDELNYIS